MAERTGWQRLVGLLVGAALSSAGCTDSAGSSWPERPAGPVGLVDPFIGTAAEGNTFPGATLPWGLASPSPHTRLSWPDAHLRGEALVSAGYVAGDPHIEGFGLTHISGAGCPDLGAPVVGAISGPVTPDREDRASAYRDEHAWPGYYGVELVDSDARVEMTATPRVGLFRFRFEERGTLVVDTARTLAWVDPEGDVRIVSPSEVEGFAETGRLCFTPPSRRVYFVARLSRPADRCGTFDDEAVSDELSAAGPVGAWLEVGPGEVELRVAVSLVSIEGARRNLEAEASATTFDDALQAAEGAWAEALDRARVSGGAEEDRRIYYTALYHALLHPSVASDVDGGFRRFGGGEGSDPEHVRYHLFSLWDTYRTVHPLLTLLYPEAQGEMVRSLLSMTVAAGAPPKWELAGDEVQMMVGDPAAIVVAESAVKGLVPDRTLLEEAVGLMRQAALDPTKLHRPGNASYRGLGYVPMEEEDVVWGPVSTTLEYALADAALLRLGEVVGLDADPGLVAGAESWRNLLDAETGFFRPRLSSGEWLEPFDPDALEGSRSFRRSGGPGYVEGSAWHYAFAAPHAVRAHADALSGPAAYVERLQSFFDLGKLAMWNEPDIGFAYHFTHFDGEGWRAAVAVDDARRQCFGATPDGLPGNDDVGTLSAWYVLSALGLYPDDPIGDDYALGAPLFDRAELRLADGRTLTIEAPHPSHERAYVREARLDGREVGQRLRYDDLVRGQTLELELSDAP